MFRAELPRIYELSDLVPSPRPPGAYFRDLDKSLGENPQKLKQYRDVEADLRGLDDAAWRYLKGELTPLLRVRHKTRGWQQLFDKLNQAKAYNYLANIGCTEIRFVPESNSRRTPDLEAMQTGQKVLCEVKTLNVSENVVKHPLNSVFSITDSLPQGFFQKLEKNIINAYEQMNEFCLDGGARRIIYLIINFDDRLHEYADRYQAQIDKFLGAQRVSNMEIATYIKPPFYSALS